MSREFRLELLKLTKGNVERPDLKAWIARAQELEAWCNGAGQPPQALPKAGTLSLPADRTPGPSSSPAQRR